MQMLVVFAGSRGSGPGLTRKTGVRRCMELNGLNASVHVSVFDC